MATEIEIKLELSDDAIESLLGSDLLGEPQDVLQQSSTYFDTGDHKLAQEDFSLRIRHVGEAWIQAVKASGPAKSLFARSEWETPVQGDEPVLDLTSPLRGEFGTELELQTMFKVVVERRVWNVQENGSRLEVVVDRGDVISGDRRSWVREAEIELKDGDPRDLFVLARKIDAVVPFRFGVQSKCERGYALGEQQRMMFKTERLQLERHIRPIAAFREISASCFRQFRLNETVLLQRRNPEALHQSRVALRRLRSAFSLFKSILPGDEPKRLQGEFRWLAGVLGEARNIDVLLVKTKDADLRGKLKEIRTKSYFEAIEALNSSRARALMLDFTEWLYCGDVTVGGEVVEAENASASAFAARALDKIRKKLKKHGRALADTDDVHRHEVRKDAKKLRYAAEFFGSLFGDKHAARRYRKLIVAMEEMQDYLGALNDLATGRDVLEQHGLADHPAHDTAVSDDDKDALISTAQASVNDVLETKCFWR